MIDDIAPELGMIYIMHLDKHDDEVIDLKWGMMEVDLFKMDPIIFSDIACDTLKIRDNTTLEYIALEDYLAEGRLRLHSESSFGMAKET